MLLKTLIKEHLPVIYEKMAKLNFSIDIFFGKYLINMCSELFPYELVFRLWDILFYTYN